PRAAASAPRARRARTRARRIASERSTPAPRDRRADRTLRGSQNRKRKRDGEPGKEKKSVHNDPPTRFRPLYTACAEEVPTSCTIPGTLGAARRDSTPVRGEGPRQALSPPISRSSAPARSM